MFGIEPRLARHTALFVMANTPTLFFYV
jgi:multidrug resistance protein, MATE family